MLNADDTVSTITNKRDPSVDGASNEKKQCEAWKKIDRSARYMLAKLHAKQSYWGFEHYESVKNTWDALKDNFGVISVTCMRTLITKFDDYKDPQHFMKKYLPVMTTMIKNLRAAGHTRSDEQKIQGILASLSDILLNGILLCTT